MKNSFEIKSWEEESYLETDNGGKYSKATIFKQYAGELSGNGQLEYLMAYRASGVATFTGVEHFEGRLGERIGSFSLMHEGRFENGVVTSSFVIIDGSQTAGLYDIAGAGNYQAGHSMTVDFDFVYKVAD